MQNTKKPTIIGIAGGTSSGKTTIILSIFLFSLNFFNV